MVAPQASQTNQTQNSRDSQEVNKGSQQQQQQQRNDDDETPCGKCKEVECVGTIGNGRKKVYKTLWISCDACAVWYHAICQDLQNADANSIKKLANHGVRWYCDTCISKKCEGDTVGNTSLHHKTTINKLDGIEKAIKEMQKSYSAALQTNTEQIAQLKENYAQVVQKSAKQIEMATVSNENTEKMLRRQQQMNEAESRKLNAIIYGINEEESPVLDQVKQFMTRECFKKSNPPVMAMRLGRKSSDEDENRKPRPIKLVFENESSKWDFVKRVNSGTMKQENIFCKIDTSQEVRNQEWVLREKIRELKGSDVTAEYRIRNLQIEQKQLSGNWELLKPEVKEKETTI